jgi:hypothetical protein
MCRPFTPGLFRLGGMQGFPGFATWVELWRVSGAVSENLSQIPQLVTIGENFLDVFLARSQVRHSLWFLLKSMQTTA